MRTFLKSIVHAFATSPGLVAALVCYLVVMPTSSLAAPPAGAARATVFRCTTPQRVFYTDLGCANAQEVQLKAPAGRVDPLSSGERARVAEIDRDLARRRALMGQQARQTQPLKRPTHADTACRRDRARDLLQRMGEGGHKKSQLRARMRELKTKPRNAAPTCS